MSAAGNRRLRLVSLDGMHLEQPNELSRGTSSAPMRRSEACSIWERSEPISWDEFLALHGDHPYPDEDPAGAEAYHAALRRWFEHNGRIQRGESHRQRGLNRVRGALARAWFRVGAAS